MKEPNRSYDQTNLSSRVRKQHEITLNMLIEDAQVDPSAVLLLDTWNIGEAGIIDTLLESLSRLSGTRYRRDLLTGGGFTFVAVPPHAPVAAEMVKREGCDAGSGMNA